MPGHQASVVLLLIGTKSHAYLHEATVTSTDEACCNVRCPSFPSSGVVGDLQCSPVCVASCQVPLHHPTQHQWHCQALTCMPNEVLPCGHQLQIRMTVPARNHITSGSHCKQLLACTGETHKTAADSCLAIQWHHTSSNLHAPHRLKKSWNLGWHCQHASKQFHAGKLTLSIVSMPPCVRSEGLCCRVCSLKISSLWL